MPSKIGQKTENQYSSEVECSYLQGILINWYPEKGVLELTESGT